MTARVVFDRSACAGHGFCSRLAESIFEMDSQDGLANLLLDVVHADDVSFARSAAEACPERAISTIYLGAEEDDTQDEDPPR